MIFEGERGCACTPVLVFAEVLKLVSEYGNEVIITENRYKIQWLKSLGFTQIEENEQPKPAKAKKGAKNGDQKETKRDI